MDHKDLQIWVAIIGGVAGLLLLVFRIGRGFGGLDQKVKNLAHKVEILVKDVADGFKRAGEDSRRNDDFHQQLDQRIDEHTREEGIVLRKHGEKLADHDKRITSLEEDEE